MNILEEKDGATRLKSERERNGYQSKLCIFGVVHPRIAPESFGDGSGFWPQAREQIRAIDELAPHTGFTAENTLSRFVRA